MKDLERRQAEMKLRQSQNNLPCSPVRNPEANTYHHCEMRNVSFCCFCGERIDGSGEREVNGFPKTDHRCDRRLWPHFCPFCGDNLMLENDKNALLRPLPVVVREHPEEEKKPKKVKVIRWNKIHGHE